MNRLNRKKLLFIFFSISTLFTSCQFAKYIKASDYNFSDYINEPIIGMPAKEMWRKNNIWIYEVKKNKGRPIARIVQEFRTDSSKYYISLLYKKMMIADDMTNEIEVYPVIIDMNGIITHVGKNAYDSLRMIRFTERMK